MLIINHYIYFGKQLDEILFIKKIINVLEYDCNITELKNILFIE
jgi:hypothetical protein